MKKLFSFALLTLLLVGVYSCHKKGEPPLEAALDTELLRDTTTIEFLDSTTFVFDTINEGDKVEHDFHFKNTGDKNLIIARAFGSCGCTVPEYPKEPVKPGASGVIHVTFNSAGKRDEQTKQITIVCNTEKHQELLYLKGFVKAKED